MTGGNSVLSRVLSILASLSTVLYIAAVAFALAGHVDRITWQRPGGGQYELRSSSGVVTWEGHRLPHWILLIPLGIWAIHTAWQRRVRSMGRCRDCGDGPPSCPKCQIARELNPAE